jgi:HlyD family secretion protein
LTQTSIDSWEASISTARTNVNTATVNLSTADEKLKTAISALSLAEQEMELLLAGTTEEEVNAQRAQVEKAEADVSMYQADLSKMFLYSPISGVVTVQDAKVGEIVSANTVLVSIISDTGYEIKADVPEVDIVKTEIGDIAEVTLDAYGDDVIFSATVVKIDPAETVIEGVPSYKTTLQFDRDDERILPGMTANLDIITDIREDVIVIPQRAVVAKNGDKFVRVLQIPEGARTETVSERTVITGLKDSFGNIEIVEGVVEGERVVTFVKEN